MIQNFIGVALPGADIGISVTSHPLVASRQINPADPAAILKSMTKEDGNAQTRRQKESG